jgi:hypothetical protein
MYSGLSTVVLPRYVDSLLHSLYYTPETPSRRGDPRDRTLKTFSLRIVQLGINEESVE